VALDALARSMEAELSTCQLTGDAGADAVRRLSAVGRGYVHFALAEPGRFATAFAPRTVPVADAPFRPSSHAASQWALAGMLDAGVLDAADPADPLSGRQGAPLLDGVR
jgi:Tetracyclin repressor-like, C-terminal domain